MILVGDCLTHLRSLESESVHCIVTSPPYYGLRNYGVDGQIGLEKTPQEFVAKITEIFEECRRVLRKDGTCWVNLGDSYALWHGIRLGPDNVGAQIPARILQRERNAPGDTHEVFVLKIAAKPGRTILTFTILKDNPISDRRLQGQAEA